ncbi:helix-turn-helix domain-containing protein [Desulfovibrio sp.]|uniref:helix-turn-helix domain-containing protein n=1 Tax=Desulfovibrio sp. TaxID=885 RepID=UPI0025B91B8C|nr:helix-turn-helix domain-containing protein [Desulfovibrio sp.]
MTLEELGAALRAEREQRGLSIEDAANHLKIGARLLRALEAGDTSSLPHLAYTKGFIRSYSAYVGLSTEEVGAALATLEATSEEAAAQHTGPPEIYLAPRRSFKPFFVALVLILLGFGAYVAWQQGALEFLSSQTRRMAQPAPMQRPDTDETPAPLSTARPGPEAARTDSPARQSGGADQPAATTATQTVAPAAPSGPQQAETAAGSQAAPVAAPATAPASATVPAAAANPESAAVVGPHKVIITATEECWVHSSADHTDTRQFSLRKGDTFALTFNKSLELKLGNAGGVRIRYNGEELPPVGGSGQVRTLTFPPARQ